MFGSAPALATLGELIASGPEDDICDAVQVAVASFTRYGFEAAAITALMRTVSLRRDPDQIGVERTATLRFDHPYAARGAHRAPTVHSLDQQPYVQERDLPPR